MTTIAVVIPVWNRAATLVRAIESALAQQPDELVVVDDCSTDDSAAIARQYPVCVVEHPTKSENWIEALGTVYKSLSSDYVIGMGADDVLFGSFALAVRQVVDESPGVVFSDYALLRDGNPPIPLEIRQYEFASVTKLTAAGARQRFRSLPRWRAECGAGAAIRRDDLVWLHDSQYWRMGPYSDSIGYTVAAMRRGCVYVPEVHGGFVVQQERPSYHQQIVQDENQRQRYLEAVGEWLSLPEVASIVQDVEFHA